MNINSITTNTSYLKGRAIGRMPNNARDCEKKRHNINQYNNDQINTTINANNNADGRVSFKGGNIVGQVKKPLLHTIANFASDNPLVAEALFAIFITCGLRPLTIMATAKTPEDKEKCSYQAAKSVSTGLVGLATSILVGTPISKAVKHAKANNAFVMNEQTKQKTNQLIQEGIKQIKEFANKTDDAELKNSLLSLLSSNGIDLQTIAKKGKGALKNLLKSLKEKAPEDIYKTIKQGIKAQTSMNNYSGANKNVIEKIFQPIFMPLRATITIALVPIILTALGLKKTQSKGQNQNINPYQMLNDKMFHNTKEQELFKSFLGGGK